MKYYDGHESTYRVLEANGESCWDKTAFDAFYMRPFLELALSRLNHAPGKHALDLGCGTGPATCVLSAHGYEALGVDLSPTAIHMARTAAAERNLTARFEVRDVLEIEGDACFDLVVDSHCLHCIIFDEDRRQLYATVQRLLKPNGAFVVETMSRHADARFDDQFILDDAGVLWRHYDRGDRAGIKLIDGKPYHPNRRIMTSDALESELRGAGFKVDLARTEPEEHPGDPRTFQAIVLKE